MDKTSLEGWQSHRKGRLKELAGQQLKNVGKVLLYGCGAVTILLAPIAVAEIASGNNSEAVTTAEADLAGFAGTLAGAGIIVLGNDIEANGREGAENSLNQYLESEAQAGQQG